MYELIGAMFKQRRQMQEAGNALRQALRMYRTGRDTDGIVRVEEMLKEMGV